MNRFDVGNLEVDWDNYFRLRKGDDVDVELERDALVSVLETSAEICREISEAKAEVERS